MTTALFPGHFDPISNGQVELIERASHLFDAVVVAVLEDDAPHRLLPFPERVRLVQGVVRGMASVQVVSGAAWPALAIQAGADCVLVGIRHAREVEAIHQEFYLAHGPSPLEVVALLAAPEYAFITNALIRDVTRLGGDFSPFVPPLVQDALTALNLT